MNWIDIVIAAVLLYSGYKGFTKGFIFQAASLGALLIGIYGAIRFSDFTSQFLTKQVEITSKYLPIISFAVTFFAIVVLVHFTAGFIEKIIKAIALGFINRILGLILGFGKVAFILSICIMLLEGFDKNNYIVPLSKKEHSYLYYPLSKLAPSIFPYLEFENIKTKVDETTNEMQV